MNDEEVVTRHCQSCGYSLQGLAENRCPECGRGFDPRDISTFASRIVDGEPLLKRACIGLAFFLVPVCVWAANRLLGPFTGSQDSKVWFGLMMASAAVIGLCALTGWLLCLIEVWNGVQLLRDRHIVLQNRDRCRAAVWLGGTIAAIPLLYVAYTILVALYTMRNAR